jgi:hypothetical protein
LDMIKMVETSRMSWCLADVLNVYGDKGLSPGNGLWGPAASPVIYPDETPTVEFESISPMVQPEGTILDSPAGQNSIPSDSLEGQMYFGDPSNGDTPVMVYPNDSSSSRNPPRSLMRGNATSTPTVNSATPIQNSNYVPTATSTNPVTPVGYQRTYQPVGSQPSLSDAPSRTTR